MKKIGYLVIMGALVIGIIIGGLPVGFAIEPLVGISFLYFLLGIYILILDKKGSNSIRKDHPVLKEQKLKCYGECKIPIPASNGFVCLNCGCSLKPIHKERTTAFIPKENW
jgi:hypothetical protein